MFIIAHNLTDNTTNNLFVSKYNLPYERMKKLQVERWRNFRHLGKKMTKCEVGLGGRNMYVVTTFPIPITNVKARFVTWVRPIHLKYPQWGCRSWMGVHYWNQTMLCHTTLGGIDIWRPNISQIMEPPFQYSCSNMLNFISSCLLWLGRHTWIPPLAVLLITQRTVNHMASYPIDVMIHSCHIVMSLITNLRPS